MTSAADAATPAVGAGALHSAALKTDGTVSAWGGDEVGQLGNGRVLKYTSPKAVNGVTGVRAISGGDSHTLALMADGTVTAWGNNEYGQLGDGTTVSRSVPARVGGLSGVVSVTAGFYQSFAVKSDGSAWRWGGGQVSPVPIPELSSVVAIAAGTRHQLALRSDGTVWSWGGNDSGQLGDGTTNFRQAPAPVAGLGTVVAIAAGEAHSLALRTDGAIRAWGSNYRGALGDETTVNRLVPVAVVGIGVAVAISSKAYHSLALRSDGTVVAWGDNVTGALGQGINSIALTGPITVGGLPSMVSISAGAGFNLARRSDGSLWAWGWNEFGQLGDGTTDDRYAPIRVPGATAIAAIAPGWYHSVVLTNDGRVYCWGWNRYGESGDGAENARSTPRVVEGLSGLVDLSVGGEHTVAIRDNGRLVSWGRNNTGQLGDGTQSDRSRPVEVAGISSVVAVSAGSDHTAALTGGGNVYVWGNVFYPPTGPPSGTSQVPNLVADLGGIRAVSAGGRHTVALRSDGVVLAFGLNSEGQLGDGTTSNRSSSAAVPGLAPVSAISAGYEYTLVLQGDGTVWSWGSNRFGQLGDGTTTNRSRPVRVTGLTDVVAISAGLYHSVALKRDGTVWTWGYGNYGQLGDGTVGLRTTPVQAIGIVDAVSVSAGYYHTLARKRDGTVWAWGRNVNGRVGDGTFADRPLPVVVLREEGAGSIESNNWFLDLVPATIDTIPPDKVPSFLVVAGGGVFTANVKFRAQDVGTVASVYVFALAPASAVRPAARPDEAFPALGVAKTADGKETVVACVLAQLNSAGQLQQVSSSSLQAYVTGVLGSQGQSVVVLGTTGALNIGGTTFYVGYGTSSGDMFNGGSSRSVFTLPGAMECKPQPPQTGWWWNKNEGGRGFSIEVQGNKIFYAAFLYDESGRSKWHVATGRTSLDGSLFTGDLLEVRNGQTLAGAYRAPNPITSAGPLTLAFANSTAGTMVWPGGTVAIERFAIIPNGLTAPPQENVPESGWWWNPAESGRGFFIEWQNGSADLAGYMYDEGGNPVWYLSVQPTPNPLGFTGNWWTYANGQTLTGAYRPATQTSNTFAPVSIQFHSRESATLTLPGGRTTNLVRHRF